MPGERGQGGGEGDEWWSVCGSGNRDLAVHAGTGDIHCILAKHAQTPGVVRLHPPPRGLGASALSAHRGET
jgi:hypothetical protein